MAGVSGHVFYGVFFQDVCVCAGEVPAHLFEVEVDVGFAGVEFGEVFWMECALFFVLFFFGGVFGCYLFDLLAKGFDLSFFLIEQTLLFFYFLGVYDYFFGGDEGFLEGAFGVVRAVAVVDPLDEFK